MFTVYCQDQARLETYCSGTGLLNYAYLSADTQQSPDYMKYETDISPLVNALSFFHPVSPGIQQFFERHLTTYHFKKKKLLLKAGTTCEYLFFVVKGALRGYIKEGKKEITTWITVENELVTSIPALSNIHPSREYIQAIEDTEVLMMKLSDLDRLYQEHPDFNITGRKLLQLYYSHAEDRAYIARLSKAKHKYRYFLDSKQALATRIPLKYIASYLGMTLETLSKIRSQLAKS